MELSLVVAGGTVVTHLGMRKADVGVRSGRIVKVGAISKAMRQAARHVVDARDCLVMPGAIDPHVHFDLTIGKGMKTADDFDTGTRAAVAGGVTTFIDYTTPEPGQRPLDAYRARRKLADPLVRCDYSLHNVLIDWQAAWRKDLVTLTRRGVPSVKLFMIYGERGWQADDGMLLEMLELSKKVGFTVCLHAENDALIQHYGQRTDALPAAKRPGAIGLPLSRPPLCEEEAVARAIFMARHTGGKLHLVHLSTALAAEMVGRAAAEKLAVSGETCPQYLTLSPKLLGGPDGHRFGCCPPLRPGSERRGLFKAVREGWLSTFATDHCCFNATQKDSWQGDYKKIPSGLPGVETALPLTWTLGPARKQLSVQQWAAMHTWNPARLFGLFPRKGSLQTGTDADMIIWDPKVKRRIRASELQTRCDWSPYQGQVLTGRARHVFLRGIEVAREGSCLRRPVRGKFVLRQP